MRRCLTHVGVAVAAMSFSLPAFAQGATACPPGSWFCADAQVTIPGVQPAPPAPRAVPQPPPPTEEPAEPAPPPPVRRPRYAQPAAPPPVVVYQPVPAAPPPQVIIVTPGGYGYGYGQGGYGRPVRPAPPPPPPAKPRWQSEFGLNLRVEGVALGHAGNSGSAVGMGGVGMSLRYRPVPAFAFDLGVDLLAGNDYHGLQRTEIPLSLSGMLYLNPRSRVQVYLQAGANYSHATVRSDESQPQLQRTDGGDYGAKYSYIGGQGGGGLEFRLSRHVALNLDVIGFVRKRLGDDPVPEFTDPDTGRTTNTSGGALGRGGLTFWW